MTEKVTIEDLAGMIARGFEGTVKKADMGAHFDKVEERLDRIGNLLLADHNSRIIT